MSFKLSALMSAVFLLGGCSMLARQIGIDIDKSDTKASSLVKNVGQTAPGVVIPQAPLVTHESGIWLGKNVVKLSRAALPPIFYQSTTFDRTVNSLTELAERITLRSGIPSKVSSDAIAVSNTAFSGRGNSPASSPLMAGLPFGVPGGGPTGAQSPPVTLASRGFPPNPMAPIATSSIADMPNNGVRISYSNGPLKGLLDTVSARFGVSWKYAEGTIQFFHTDSRTFQISAIPGDSTFSANVTSGANSTGGLSGGSGGGGPGGGSAGGSGVSANNNQNTAVVSKLAVYSGIESAIKVMLSPYGKVLASPATGAITVVDTPDSLDRIAAYIESENRSLSQQIAINVTVLSVSLRNTDEYGINWSAVYNSLSRHFGITNTFTPATSDVAFTAGIVGSSKFSGTTAVINALSEQGKVRRNTTASVVTLNNQPVPVQVATQTTYLASSQTSVVPQVGTTTTLVPGVVTAGFNMSILPHVLTNGTVMLQFSTDISTLRSIRQISSNSTMIESPEIDTRNFLQRVSMKSNETLIISGFEQTDDSNDYRGVGTPQNYLLGGGVNGSKAKEVIVILITPVTMSGA